MEKPYAEEAKGVYWEALYRYVLSAQEENQRILDWPATQRGVKLLGMYYTKAADLLSPVLWCAYGNGGGPINTLLTFAIITSAHLKEIACNPGSTESLHTLAIQNYPKILTDELWGEMQRILEVWRYGSFQPTNYPATFEETVSNEDDEQSSPSASSTRQ